MTTLVYYFIRAIFCLFVYQLLSHVLLFVILWTATHQAPPSFSVFWSLFRFMSIKLVMLSNHLILCCRLLLLSSIFPSIRFFSNELALCIRRPNYWNFSNSPSTEYSWLISFRIDWFDLLDSPRDSQESSPAPQFESINSLVLSHHGPLLTLLC